MENIHCTPCNYSTNIKANFRNHLLTKSHVTKCRISLVCHKCLRKFSRQKPCSQHANDCKIDLYPKSFERTTTSRPKPDNDHYDRNTVLSIKDLHKKEFTTNLHKMCLTQMMNEQTNIIDYIDKIDSIIEDAKIQYDRDQQDDYDCGDIKKIKEYTLPIQRFHDYVMSAICDSTTGIVITHIDLSMDGNSRYLLFKHEGMLRSDVIIREIAQRSRFLKYIVINEKPLPIHMDKYKELLSRLYAIAVNRRNEISITRKKIKFRRNLSCY